MTKTYKIDLNKENSQVKNRFFKYIPFLVVIVLVGVLTIINKNFISLYNIETILLDMAPLLIMSCGLTFVILIGSIDLSIGSIVSASCISLALLVGKVGFWVFLIVPLIGLMAGFINGLIFTKFRIPSFITTLGTMGIWTTFSFVATGGHPIHIFRKYGCYINWARETILYLPMISIIALVVLAISFVLQEYTSFGKAVFAIGAGEKAAKISGVRVNRIKVFVFMICGLFSGIAGSFLAAKYKSGIPFVGDPLLLISITAVVLGGVSISGGSGSVLNTLLGVIIIIIVRNGMNIIGIDAFWQQIVFGCVIIIALCLTIRGKKTLVIK